jgi:excinuclease UvrABC ATPase subunit
MRLITLSLGVVRLETDPDHQSDRRCPSCQEEFGFLQPDVESPDRLLGVCPECRGWFLVDSSSGVMVRLPDQAALREI